MAKAAERVLYEMTLNKTHPTSSFCSQNQSLKEQQKPDELKLRVVGSILSPSTSHSELDILDSCAYLSSVTITSWPSANPPWVLANDLKAHFTKDILAIGISVPETQTKCGRI